MVSSENSSRLEGGNPTGSQFPMYLPTIYLTCHLIWGKIISGPDSFFVLRALFIASYITFLLTKKDVQSLRDIFLGFPNLTKKTVKQISLYVALTCMLRLLFRYGYEGQFNHLVPGIVSDVIAAPINEEIVFRAFFLTALVKYSPLSKAFNIVLGTAIFVGVHDSFFPIYRLAALTTLGLLCSICFMHFRSLILCILLHSVWNSLPYLPIPDEWSGRVFGYQVMLPKPLLPISIRSLNSKFTAVVGTHIERSVK